ncbi:MAG: hypothetical protein ABFS14_04350 [Gemmatimonadota bacterium]
MEEAGVDRADLEESGWTRRYVGAPPQLDDQIELYRSLGLEVRLEPVEPADLADLCEGCSLATTLFRVIYTRRAT